MTQRLDKIEPGEMSAEQVELYRRFTTGARAAPGASFSLVDELGRLDGPPNAWLLSPGLGGALEQLGAAIRFGLSLSPRAAEIAILTVAHHRQSAYELHAHTKAARTAGLTEDDLAALAAGSAPQLRTSEEAMAYQVTQALLGEQSLDEDRYWTAVDVLGRPKLFELVTLVGYYQLLATQLAVFDIQPEVADAG